MKRVWLWWSSGKDSAWALHRLRTMPDVEVTSLVTTVNETFDRIAMHAVRTELLRQQARAADLELRISKIPHPSSNDVYNATFRQEVEAAIEQGVSHMAFGDLFLEDVRAYRENLLRDSGVEPLFPLWGRDTRELAQEMIDGGLRARITCVDPRAVPSKLAGRVYDGAFLSALPSDADPCGENGEFHSFAYAGPMFTGGIDVDIGETVERDGFVFTDLIPAARAAAPSGGDS